MKQLSINQLKLVIASATLALMGLLANNASAQSLTSSGLRGTVNAADGAPVSGVEIDVVHTPTGRLYEATTSSSGRFNLNGLPVGGPYTVRANSIGYQDYSIQNVYLELSRTQSIQISLSDDESQIVELDAFTVEGSDQLNLMAAAAGAGSVIAGDQLEGAPTINRSFADIARLDPRVSISDGSFGAGQLVAVGQNNRMNSIQIDGVKINDQFGLESDGNPSHSNPISIDTIEEVAVELSPYDVRQSGFMGASINAVTKSGTNELEGSVYYYFEGKDMRGDNPITGAKDEFEETTYGLTLGGPILKDKLFFFLSYEELERNVAGPTPGFFPDADALQQVQTKMINDYGFDPGTFGAEGPSTLSDEKLLVKLDWNINEKHRASVRWNRTEGTNPDFTEYDDFSSSQPETNLTSHWYSDVRKNDSWVLQVYSDWTESLSSELRIGRSDFDKTPTNPNVFPEIRIDDFPGTTRDGTPTTRGELFFGRDDSRHSNDLATDIENIYLGFDWRLKDHNITFGIDREDSLFYNLFLQETFAEIEFDGLDGFLADEIDFFDKALGIQGTPIEAFSDFTVTGFFLQDTWLINDRTSASFGLRYDTVSADNSQPTNPGKGTQSFEDIFGVPNTNTVDGSSLLAPRFAFDYEFGPDNNPYYLQGGVGVFMGRNPWVWISNTFSNNGVNSVDIGIPPSGFNRADGGGLLGYLENDFDPANPVTYADPSSLSPDARSQVDVLQNGFDLPSIIKYNLKIQRDFAPESDWSWWAEGLFTQAKTQLYTVDLNIRPIGTTPDGRNLYNGWPGAGRGSDTRYSSVYQLSNSGKGESTYITAGIRKRSADNWWLDASYTWGESNDVSNQGSSTASSNFAGNPIFNQNTAEVATSAYEQKHRILIRAGYDWEWKEDWTTKFTLVYDGMSGQNYSLLFDNDYNGDGAAFDNDLFWVPDGMDDPMLDVAASSGLDEMFAFLESIGATPGLAARNSFHTQWRHRVDLNIVQEVPLGDRLQGQLFLNVLNLANLINSNAGIIDEVPFQTLAVAEGTITDEGKIAYDFEGVQATSIRAGTYSNLSRWRAQLGFRVRF